MPAATKGAASKSKKVVKFSIDCSAPLGDKVMDLGSFEKFLHDHIKVNGKAGELGSKVTITKEKTKLIVSAELPFSKRYLKYLSKRFLQKQQLRNYLRVIAKDKSSYVLKYMPNSGISPADDDE